jgi:TrmH family RNA methyltransferase
MTKYDKTANLSYTLGTTLTFELLLRKGEQAKKIYLSNQQRRDETYAKILALARTLNVPVIENNEKIFLLSDKDNVMAIGEFEKFSSELDKKANQVVLVNPSNMGNLGTIFRTCAAFNLGGLAVIRPAADVFDPKTVRSSMGAIFSVPFHEYDSFEDYQKEMGERHYYPFMLKAKTALSEAKKEKPYSLIFGNEAAGLSDAFLKVGTPLVIPQSSKVDSLNLDNAVSIACYSFCD